MRYKRLITISTILVFILAVILTLGYMMRLREVKIDFVSYSESSTIKYNEVKDKVNKFTINKNYLFFNENSLKNQIEKDSYIEVISVKKIFPCTVKVEIKQRKECFSITNESKVYVLDEAYNVLKIEESTSSPESGNINIELVNMNFDFTNVKVGQKLNLVENSNFLLMSKMFSRIDGNVNVLSKIFIYGEVGGYERNRIKFELKQGSTIVVIDLEKQTPENIDEAMKKFNELDDTKKRNSIITLLYDIEDKLLVTVENKQD